ncbi:hypothetical protein ACJJID_10570 [Microbulbifer sp. CnH-101-G]
MPNNPGQAEIYKGTMTDLLQALRKFRQAKPSLNYPAQGYEPNNIQGKD